MIERQTDLVWRGQVALLCILQLMLLAGCGKPTTIQGVVSLSTESGKRVTTPRDGTWKYEVWAVEENDLKRLVQEYNQEIASKWPEYYRRYAAAEKKSAADINPNTGNFLSGTDPLPALEAEWRALKARALRERIHGSRDATPSEAPRVATGIVGLSGGNKPIKPKPGERPFLIASADSQGRFQFTLPQRDTWCFFVFGSSGAGESCYYFKRKSFVLGHSVKIDSLEDRVDEAIPLGGDFLSSFLKDRYGLADPHIDAYTHLQDLQEAALPKPATGWREVLEARRNGYAMAFWIAISLGYLSHAFSRKSLASLFGAILIFAVAVFDIIPWAWASVCCLLVMAVVFLLAREG